MDRILHIIGKMDRGGAETLLMTIYRKIDRSKYQFDFLVHASDEGDYDAEIRELGGNVYHIKPYAVVNTLSYQKSFKELLIKHPDIKLIHGHIGSSSLGYLPVARKLGIPAVIHSHNTNSSYFFSWLIFAALTYHNRYNADYFFACSRQAGIDRFGMKVVESDRFQILNNGIDSVQFSYSESRHNDLKNRYGFEGKNVYGHVGRFAEQKNHTFLIDVFNEIQKRDPNAVLVLIGRGPLEDNIKKKTEKLGLSDKVHFLGVRGDIPDLLVMMDCYIFPSVYEGLGIALVEAEAAGLPCVCSEAIVPEAIITDSVTQLQLKDGPQKWAETAIHLCETYQRKDQAEVIKAAGYDINTSIEELTKVYDMLIHRG